MKGLASYVIARVGFYPEGDEEPVADFLKQRVIDIIRLDPSYLPTTV